MAAIPHAPCDARQSMTGARLRLAPDAATFIVAAAAFNALLYHLPLFSFAAADLDLSTFTGVLTLSTVLVALFLETLVFLALLALVSQRILKPFCMVAAVANAVAVYFVSTYHVVLDATMMGNVVNTNFAESSEYLHPSLFAYLLVLGAIPCWLLTRIRIRPCSRLRLAVVAVSGILVALLWAVAASSTWLWIDQNSKRLGGMVMPWAYLINLGRYEAPRVLASDEQVLLPPATFLSNRKTVVILVIGEAARAKDFSLYGYERPTNPLLSSAGVVTLKNATACATYTTASLRCILSHVDSESPLSRSYEPLTSYLQRSGVDVIWRSRNFGEPAMKVGTYEKADDLQRTCTGEDCAYDGVLLTGLEKKIEASHSNRVLVVLHQSGSHGPAYYSKYPPGFERFKPVCKSVDLGKCTREELVNAYDNTILYEDSFLYRTIGVLKSLHDTAALLIYVSDHGESLGEHGLYLHGIPFSMAPEVQKDIPFLLWMSDEFVQERALSPQRLAAQTAHSQRDVFHTVMGAFSMRSAVYLGNFDIFSSAYSSH
jgi:lipid A ethanolaminephosphotransferase